MPRQEKTCRIAQTATISVAVFSSIDFDDHDRVYRTSPVGNNQIKIGKRRFDSLVFFSTCQPGLRRTIQLQKHSSILRTKSNDN